MSLNVSLWRDLGNRGRVGMNWDGTVIIQQGRPHGSMVNPGEAFLTIADLATIVEMVREFEASGKVILPPDAIRAL